MKDNALIGLAIIVFGAILVALVDIDEPATTESTLRWIARDFGAIIAGLIALAAAGITLTGMREQTAKQAEINERIRAVEFAGECRTYAEELRASHYSFFQQVYSVLICFPPAMFRAGNYTTVGTQASVEATAKELATIERLPSPPTFPFGKLPLSERRAHAFAKTLFETQLTQWRDSRTAAELLTNQLEAIVPSWLEAEAVLHASICFLERRARILEETGLVDIMEDVVQLEEDEIAEIANSLHLRLQFPQLLAWLKISVDASDMEGVSATINNITHAIWPTC